MPRPSKSNPVETATTDAPKKRRGRPAKAAAAPAADAVVITAAEQAIVAKYPKVSIVAGSWLASGGRPDWGNKATVVIKCAVCETERILATSDLFHVSMCAQHAKDARKNRKAKHDLSKSTK